MFFYIDDELVGTVSRYFTIAGPEIGCEISPGYYVINPAYPPVDKHYRVIVNAAVVGSPASNNEVPEGTMEIDYIRVYEFDECNYTTYACEEGVNNPVAIINNDQEWDKCETLNIGDQFEYIRVTSNNTLTLKECDLKMLLPGKIIVESGATLILDNTTIRPCDESYRWLGIFIDNGANIELKNGSKIIQSRMGIFNSFDFVGYVDSEGAFDPYALFNSTDAGAGNNSVIIDNSSFENNFHALLLDGDNDISVQNNSLIKGSYHGATIRENQNGVIDFKFCDFEQNLKSIHLGACGEDNSIYNCKFTNDNSVFTQIHISSTEGLDFQMNEMSSPGHHIQAIESHIRCSE